MDDWYWKCKPMYWHNLTEVRQTYPDADDVRMSDGTIVTVFNIGGNKFRIVTRINYLRFTMRITHVLTHIRNMIGRSGSFNPSSLSRRKQCSPSPVRPTLRASLWKMTI